MDCPNCGGKTYVIDARPSESYAGSYRRRRICYKCKNRFTTYEILPNMLKDSNNEKQKELLKQINELIIDYMKGEIQ